MKRCYVHTLTPYNECNHCVVQAHTDKNKNKNEKQQQKPKILPTYREKDSNFSMEKSTCTALTQ